MPTHSRNFYRSLAPLAGLLVAAAACHDDHDITNVVPTASTFTQTNLVSDGTTSGAAVVDPLLVNAWGIAFGGTGSLWVSNNGSGTSTVYSGSGAKASLTVTIPGAGGAAGVPTGQLFNSTTGFAIGTTGPASFIFAGEDGTISAWNSASGTTAQIVANRSAAGAVYKGIAMASSGGVNHLFLTDFHNGKIDMYDASFTLVSSLTDGTMAAGYAPFGIANIGNQLYVTYAKQEAPDNEDDQAGPGNGYVDVFNADGTFAKRFVSNGALNSPWAVVAAPTGFGTFAGDILVGNFGDGHVLAYNPTDGSFVGNLTDTNKNALVIDGLWGLEFGPAAGSTTLYFAAGPGDESHGLLGTIVVH